MNLYKYVPSVLLFLSMGMAFPMTLFSAESLDNIAIVDFTGRNIPDQVAAIFSDMLRTQFVNLGTHSVLDKANMDQLLREASFQQTGVTDAEYAVKIGKILNVKSMVLGTVSRLDDVYYINANMVNVQSGRIEKSATLQTKRTDEFLSISQELAWSLSTKIETHAKTPTSAPDSLPKRTRKIEKYGGVSNRFALGLGNPYASISYSFSRQYMAELRYAFDIGESDNMTRISMVRLYRMGQLQPDSALSPYIAAEYGFITFMVVDTNGVQKDDKESSMVGAYVGFSYSLTKRISLMFDLGPTYIDLGYGIAGIEWVINTGLKVNLF